MAVVSRPYMNVPQRKIPIYRHTNRCVQKRRRQIESLRGYSVFRSTDSLRDVYEGHCLRCCGLCALRLCCIWLPDPHIHPLFRKRIKVAKQRTFLRKTGRSCSCTYLGNENYFAGVTEERDPNSIQVRFANVDIEDPEMNNICSDFVYYDSPSREYGVINSHCQRIPEEGNEIMLCDTLIRNRQEDIPLKTLNKTEQDYGHVVVNDNFEHCQFFPGHRESFLLNRDTVFEQDNCKMSDQKSPLNYEHSNYFDIEKCLPVVSTRQHDRFPPEMCEELLKERKYYRTDKAREIYTSPERKPTAHFYKEHNINDKAATINTAKQCKPFLENDKLLKNVNLDRAYFKHSINKSAIKKQISKEHKNPFLYINERSLHNYPTSIMFDSFPTNSSFHEESCNPHEINRSQSDSNMIISKLTRYVAHILYNLFSLNISLEVALDLINDLSLSRGKPLCLCSERYAFLERSKECSRHMDNIFRMYFSPRTGNLAYLDLPEPSVLFYEIRAAVLNLLTDDTKYKEDHERLRRPFCKPFGFFNIGGTDTKKHRKYSSYETHSLERKTRRKNSNNHGDEYTRYLSRHIYKRKRINLNVVDKNDNKHKGYVNFRNKTARSHKMSFMANQIKGGESTDDAYKYCEDFNSLEKEWNEEGRKVHNEEVTASHDINHNLASAYNYNIPLENQRNLNTSEHKAKPKNTIMEYDRLIGGIKDDLFKKATQNVHFQLDHDDKYANPDKYVYRKGKPYTGKIKKIKMLERLSTSFLQNESSDIFLTMLHTTNQARKNFALALDRTVQLIENIHKLKRHSDSKNQLQLEMQAEFNYFYSLSQARALIYIRCTENLKHLADVERRKRDLGV